MKCRLQTKNQSSFDRENITSRSYIFYKENKTRRENLLFLHYIKKYQIQYFKGFIFEEKFKAVDILKYNYKDLKFEDCVFNDEVNFSDFIFNTKVSFSNCKFLGGINFVNCQINNRFLIKDCYFNNDFINNKIFKSAKINCQNFILENNDNLPRLDGIIFSRESKFSFRNCDYNSHFSEVGRINYSIAKIQADRIRDLSNMGYYNYNERKYRNKTLSKKDFANYPEYILSKLLNYISREFMGYGEHLTKLLLYIIGIISFFAFLYMLIGVYRSPSELVRLDLRNLKNFTIISFLEFYLQFWYFSFVTFTTVGFGDIIVSGILGKVLVCIEVFLGISMEAT